MAFDYVKYQTDYVKKTYRQFMLKINRGTESDIMDWLESQENVQAYLKELVRKDMKRKLARTQSGT